MWAAQAGWNSVTPKTWNCTRGEMLVKQGEEENIRLAAGEYLTTALSDLGYIARGEDGAESVLDWPALWAYAQATGVLEEAWEFRIIRDMSAAYLRGRHEGMDVLSMPPVMRAG